MVSCALSGVQMRPRTNSGHSLSRFSVPLLPKPHVPRLDFAFANIRIPVKEASNLSRHSLRQQPISVFLLDRLFFDCEPQFKRWFSYPVDRQRREITFSSGFDWFEWDAVQNERTLVEFEERVNGANKISC